ncbi:MAG TPA: ATP-binding cassette domain-containing protein [Saprospiraceae bacterium]|jgi:phospholipid/cholesterol/gamma-HCH transport system ATP-binding protein|nr:ATP-binding cassette domain-containing protein [Saprospiraceae bacterium]HRO08433.1 ATP-binding cassette domain-containing protein [Saprospiraceae bacterium]HRO73433.1 ATP-binding cassette domain-containing protein [Saprospiraceae bacterium]HRP41818.1 ATP-binding cassette domain-containing protein [Saprospiraceae bacterium]
MIRAENIFKRFGQQEVLKGITTTFEAGKTNLVIGKSGSGKTVLLKVLVGLFKPEKGRVLFGDTDMVTADKDTMRRLRMEVGMLFQGNALFDSMTIEENVRFPLDMFTHQTLKEKTDRVNYCLERVSLEGVNKKFPSEISGGMQKRVGIARAIVLNPKYLFCDEPNSGLDPKTSITIDDLISGITKDNNITTVINTHDMNSVMEIGENIILLEKGELAWQGHKNEVLHDHNKIMHDFIFASPFLQKLIDQVQHKI